MALLQVKARDMTNVNPGQEATASLNVGNETYKCINLICTKEDGSFLTVQEMRQQFGDITLVVNAENQLQIAVSDLFDFHNYYYSKRYSSIKDGIIPINFIREYLHKSFSTKRLAQGTADIVSFNINLAIKQNATVKRIEVYTDIHNAEPSNRGSHYAITRDIKQISTSGTIVVDDIFKKSLDTDILAAVHIKDVGNKIKNVTLFERYTSDRNIFERIKSLNNYQLVEQGRTPQQGFWHLDFQYRNEFLLPYSLLMKPDIPMGLKLDIEGVTEPFNLEIFIERVKDVNREN
jgi:hypothetical protein